MSKRIDPRSKALQPEALRRVLAWEDGHKSAPITLEADLSNRCPYGCGNEDGPTCHFAHTHTKGPLVLPGRRLPMLHDKGGDLADTYLVRRWMADAKDAGVQAIVWTGGGEPTVHPDFRSITVTAHDLGFRQGLYTLGATLHSQMEYVKLVMRRIFSWVVFSLDSHIPEQYAADKRTPVANFKKACDVIKALSGGKCDVGASFLLHRHNYMFIEEMLALARSLGAYANFRPIIDTYPDNPGVPVGDRSWVQQALPALQQIANEPDVEVDPARFEQWANWKRHSFTDCKGIKLNATITPDGRMWVCPNRREFADGASLLGDLRHESFSSIWARHPGHLPVDANCRAMCRLNPLSETLDQVLAPRLHAEFL